MQDCDADGHEGEFELQVFSGSSNYTSDDASANDIDVDEVIQKGKENISTLPCDGFGDHHFECPKSNNLVDASFYASKSFFAFDTVSYKLMEADLRGEITVTLEILKAHDVRGLLSLKRWKRMKDDMSVCSTMAGGLFLCLKSARSLKIACMEDWQYIVEAAHIDHENGMHKTEKETVNVIKREWCMDIRRHGIPMDYVKDCVLACGCQLISKEKPKVIMKPSSRMQSKASSEIIVTERSRVSQDLVKIMIQHHVRLVFLRSTKNSGPFEILEELICHRGGNVSRRGDNKRRLRKSKKCGCPFKIVLQYANDSNKINILLHAIHEGHVPGTRADLYYLPIHPRVIACCMDDLFDVGTCRHVARMSKSKESFHIQNASPLDRVVFRFFMIPKEVQMLSYQMRNQGSI